VFSRKSIALGMMVMKRVHKPDVPFVFALVADAALITGDAACKRLTNSIYESSEEYRALPIVLHCRGTGVWVGDREICEFLQRGAFDPDAVVYRELALSL
jgi:hypothetical protein